MSKKNRRAYQEFLKSPFWLALRSEKLKLNPKCERCPSIDNLQCHHKFYRDRWEQTEIQDLETLCKKCHRKEHGIGQPKVHIPNRKNRIKRLRWIYEMKRIKKIKIR